MDVDDIQLTLNQSNSIFVTHDILPGIYPIENISKVVYTRGDHEGTLQIDYDDITTKKKLVLTRFASTFGRLIIGEKSDFDISLRFTPIWGYKPINAIHVDSPGVNSSDKTLNLGKTDKIHMKCDVIDGSIQKGLTHPILFSFVLDKNPGFEIFCQPETIHY